MKQNRKSWIYICMYCLLFLIVFGCGRGAVKIDYKSKWNLTNKQRRKYLNYYSPIILKRSYENMKKRAGYDWITNYYFDGDSDFTNNKFNWENELIKFINTDENSNWKIRPTLYTSIIEFIQNEKKSVILLYHVYHAMQHKHIHDWERIEIRVDGLRGDPGHGEKINYVVITRHSNHDGRSYPSSELKFHKTKNGKHVLIFQAEWSRTRKSPIRKAELHFVKDDVQDIVQSGNAKVKISGIFWRKSFHYVFVNKADKEACKFWKAKNINKSSSSKMVSGVSLQPVKMKKVKRAKYELQDIADILPTHLKFESIDNGNWKGKPIKILLEFSSFFYSSAIYKKYRDELYFQWFYPRSIDMNNKNEKKDGYPKKHWFWGAYKFNRKGNFYHQAFKRGVPKSRNGRRHEASGFKNSVGRFWWQHDYFAHDGKKGNGKISGEKGAWLPAKWYTEKEGGFDGRWVKLFKD
ncbi:hypothetical protein ACFL20_13445 [Spirochaetota bacterium]